MQLAVLEVICDFVELYWAIFVIISVQVLKNLQWNIPVIGENVLKDVEIRGSVYAGFT